MIGRALRPCRFFFIVMYKKINLIHISLLAGLWVACTDAGTGVEPDLEFLKAQTADAAMSCQFVRHSKDASHQSDAAWFLFRSSDRVESFDEGSQQSQIWEKDQNGRVSEMRVFHAEKLVLEVSNGDLLASGHLPKWATLWSIVDPEDLSKSFKPIGGRTVKGVSVDRLQGLVEGVETTVEWLKPQALPILWKRTSEKGVDEVRLVRCSAPGTGPVQPTSQQQLLDYRHIDFSDLGDMESDPQVQRIGKLLGHGHDHEEDDHH